MYKSELERDLLDATGETTLHPKVDIFRRLVFAAHESSENKVSLFALLRARLNSTVQRVQLMCLEFLDYLLCVSDGRVLDEFVAPVNQRFLLTLYDRLFAEELKQRVADLITYANHRNPQYNQLQSSINTLQAKGA